MTVYTWLWIGWLALFGVIEGKSLANKKPGDTFSEHVWTWFATKDGDGERLVELRRLVLLVLLCWLLIHFMTGGWV